MSKGKIAAMVVGGLLLLGTVKACFDSGDRKVTVSGSLAGAENPAEPSRTLNVSDIGVSLVSADYGYVTYSWKAMVSNPLDVAATVNVTCKLLDKDGYELDRSLVIFENLPAHSSKRFGEQGMTKTNIWSRVARYEITAESF